MLRSPSQRVCYNRFIGMPSTETDHSKLTVEEMALRFRAEMVPLGGKFAYFTAVPVAEEDLKQYLDDPIAALPPAICESLPPVGVILVPYLQKGNGKAGDLVSYEAQHGSRHLLASRPISDAPVTLSFAFNKT